MSTSVSLKFGVTCVSNPGAGWQEGDWPVVYKLRR